MELFINSNGDLNGLSLLLAGVITAILVVIFYDDDEPLT